MRVQAGGSERTKKQLRGICPKSWSYRCVCRTIRDQSGLTQQISPFNGLLQKAGNPSKTLRACLEAVGAHAIAQRLSSTQLRYESALAALAAK